MYENLRRIRSEKKISALEMAQLIGLETAAAYYKKESGAIKFSLEEAKKIAEYLKMPIDDIFLS